MIRGHKNISELSRENVLVWFALAFQAGVLNIAGLMNSQRFVSHITGFATQFAHDISHMDWDHAFGVAIVPIFFLLGAFLGGILVDSRIQRGRPPQYYVTFGVIFFLILTVWGLGLFGSFGSFGAPIESFRDYAYLSILCLVCGLQNATVSTVSRSVIRTSHLTGITTDLGIGLARLLRLTESSGLHSLDLSFEAKINLVRFGLIVSFSTGSLIGAVIFRQLGYMGFFFPAAIAAVLFGLTLYFRVRSVQEKAA